MTPLALEENEVLFGADPLEGIVAVEPSGDRSMRLFLRHGKRLVVQEEPFISFILVEDETLMKGFKRPYKAEPLSGANEYKVLVFFEGWDLCQKARDHLQKRTGESTSSPQAPYLYISDPVHQFLLLSGKTLFKGLAFEGVHRLALDIETACAPGFEFSNPEREEDRILSIALMNNQGHSEGIFGKDMGEKEMLLALNEAITRLDPDVIEGHNLFNFDLEYLRARARRHGVPLTWGRDGSTPRVRRSRFTVAERIIDFTRMDISGRQVVDTFFLLQYYDVTAREMESYGLKAAAQHFGLAEEGRTYIEGKDIQWFFDHDPESLKKYNLEDVKETLALSELLGYPFFLQARIFPYSYQNIFVRGNATKINALFLREYLRQRASVPKPKGGGEFEGGYTDVFVTGVVHRVVHCDVASLYPSILLSYNLKPAGDTLDVFLPLLRELREFRLEAKGQARAAETPHERDYYEALQQTFKILINSFYGYLGTTLHHFADQALAAEVTRKGREIIHQMIGWLRKEGATPVEIDTDGIYFVPPEAVKTEKQEKDLVGRLNESLAEGIEVSMDGRYQAMFSYKKKNYALLDWKGELMIKGSALRSRGMEKYLREFLSDMIRLLLEGRAGEIEALVKTNMDKIEHHQVPIAWLAKTEALSESTDIYREKVKEGKRNPAALYELALASGRAYRSGDQLSYYVTGETKKLKVYENSKLASLYDPLSPDENVLYYQDKLLVFVERYKEFLPEKESSAPQALGRGKKLRRSRS
ncbi:MAG: DNA polymerase II [Desulfobacterota bacterium]|nr:DNA polymerase II [Thermodesulfobacteriota bacterium]